ncbi:hypothetical protein B0J14DRAFT_298364 [Halenospora varia]|nr:hypothetical protein B0J14DRAFT_298364 [Halenospora varia]
MINAILALYVYLPSGDCSSASAVHAVAELCSNTESQLLLKTLDHIYSPSKSISECHHTSALLHRNNIRIENPRLPLITTHRSPPSPTTSPKGKAQQKENLQASHLKMSHQTQKLFPALHAPHTSNLVGKMSVLHLPSPSRTGPFLLLPEHHIVNFPSVSDYEIPGTRSGCLCRDRKVARLGSLRKSLE